MDCVPDRLHKGSLPVEPAVAGHKIQVGHQMLQILESRWEDMSSARPKGKAHHLGDKSRHARKPEQEAAA